jgi:chitin disaccharide deacetylase
MKCFTTLLLLCTGIVSPVSQSAPPRLIVRGDDMGYSHAGNEAILACYTNGIESSVEVIVPSPWFPEQELSRSHTRGEQVED